MFEYNLLIFREITYFRWFITSLNNYRPTGTIHLEDMEFYAFHGHYKEERIVGNKFIVNLDIETDLKAASRSDKLQDALDYQSAYKIVKDQMQIKSHLLEHIAGRILDALLNEFNEIKTVSIKLSKLNPPVGGKVDRISITMQKKH